MNGGALAARDIAKAAAGEQAADATQGQPQGNARGDDVEHFAPLDYYLIKDYIKENFFEAP